MFNRHFSAALAAIAVTAAAVPAQAQIADDVVLEILRQCARIDDAGARLACFDNNIRSAGAPARATVPSMAAPVQGGSAPVTGGASGFGRENVRTAARFETPAGELEELTARLAAVEQRGMGIYLLTLEDGAQWLFTESVDPTYRPPRAGSTVEIDRGAIGSFLMRFDRQAPVGVRRLR